VKQLEGKADVTGPKANGGDSNNVVKHLAEWAVAECRSVEHRSAVPALGRARHGRTRSGCAGRTLSVVAHAFPGGP